MNKYTVIGWRLTKEQKEELKKNGYHTYACRSWDEGNGCTLEHRVIVNHEADVITNFEALNDNDLEDIRNDFYEYMDECDAEDSLYEEIEKFIN